MNPEDAVDLGREALKACILIGGPIVVLGLFVGLVVGVLQAMTQVQDQTVSFVPKILVMILGIGITLPWLSDKMIDYTKSAFETPMIHTSSPTGSFEKQPPWERRRYFPEDQELKDVGGSRQDERLASQQPTGHESGMPKLSQKYSMPTMERSKASSMPMLKRASQPPSAQTTPRIAEKLDTDF